MIITKRVLMNSILKEGRTIDDYLNSGTIPLADQQEMDNEFYAEYTERVWIMVQRIINLYIRSDEFKRNSWMFQNELNRNTMHYLNSTYETVNGKRAHWEDINMNSVKKRFSDKVVYSLMKRHNIKSEQDILEFASWLIAESLPKL